MVALAKYVQVYMALFFALIAQCRILKLHSTITRDSSSHRASPHYLVWEEVYVCIQSRTSYSWSGACVHHMMEGKGKDDSGQFLLGVKKDNTKLKSRPILSRNAIDGGLPSFANVRVAVLKFEQT